MAHVFAPSLAHSTKLSSGATYSYIHSPPSNGQSTILFLHGFPDSSYSWRHQIPFFKDKGYGLVVPDLLGYGGTDKPETLEAYKLKKMSGEVVELLDELKVDKVVGVGHDW